VGILGVDFADGLAGLGVGGSGYGAGVQYYDTGGSGIGGLCAPTIQELAF
jgi:hypothetical protein